MTGDAAARCGTKLDEREVVVLTTEEKQPAKAWNTVTLYRGSHAPNTEMCLLEAVAWFANESWSASPQCVSPVLAAFGRGWNDGMRSNEEREQLKQYIPLLVGTVAPELEAQRAFMALDWLCRVHLPAWLKLAGCGEQAALLAAHPEVHNRQTLEHIEPLLSAACAAAWAAATAASRTTTVAAVAAVQDPSWVGAWVAAGAAAQDASWAGPWVAAGVAVQNAAGDAAGYATRAATRAASGAGSALELTVQELQQSAHGLFRSMIALSEETQGGSPEVGAGGCYVNSRGKESRKSGQDYRP